MTFAFGIALSAALCQPAIVAEQTKKTPSDGMANDQFGVAIAMWGDTAVIAAPAGDAAATDEGAAYVFERSGGSWVEVAKLTASDGVMGDNLGLLSAAAMYEDTIVLGASLHAGGGGTGQGQVYVFVRPPGGWTDTTETAKLTASDGAMDDSFGQSLGIDGDTIVVGAPSDDGGAGAGQGGLYIFQKPPGGWVNATENAKLTASDAAAGNLLGYSVSIFGDTIVAGAPNSGNSGGMMQDGPGAGYVYVRPPAGWSNMVETAILTASDEGPGNLLGFSCAIHGNMIVVGAVNDGNSGGGGIDGIGSAYVFEMPAGGWVDTTQNAKLIDSNAVPVNLLGWSVAVLGDLVLAGAPNEIHSAMTQDGEGAVNAYLRPEGGWSGVLTESHKLTASDAASTRFFGVHCEVSEDWLIIGAHGSGSGMADAGAAYFFARDNDADGVGNHADNCPDDPEKLDAGVCGCGVAELDTDGDGAFDCVDACPDDDTDDSDGDGVCDSADVCAEGDDTVDVDGNGTPDACDAAGGLPVGGDCCGGGMPAMLPLLMMGLRRRPKARRRRRAAGRTGVKV